MKRYLRTVACVVALAMGSVGLINYAIDPFAVWGASSLGLYSTFDIRTERRHKLALRRQGSHDTVILGSSMAARLNPDNLPQGGRIFNLAFTAGHIPEMAHAAEALDRERFAILGLDFHAASADGDPFAPIDDGPRDQFGPLRGLFELAVLRESLFAAAMWLTGRPASIYPNGAIDDRQRIRNEASLAGFQWQPALAEVESWVFKRFRYSEDNIRRLEMMKNELDRRGIKTFVFITPLSAPLQEIVARTGLLADQERARADYRRIFPDLIDLSLHPGLDDPNLYYKTDAFHFRSGVIEPIIAPYVERLLATSVSGSGS